jgi:beta-lactamase superfamily II metal-dependent hydrolase
MLVLEALQADEGDCLILHSGTEADPQRILIDGGPGGVYKASLRPRLLELGQGGPVRLKLMMVSHIDDDHVLGLLELVDEIIREQGVSAPIAEIDAIWHNGFDDLTPDDFDAAVDAVAIRASVDSGRRLQAAARRLTATLNDQFDKLVLARPQQPATYGDVTLRVLAPSQEQLDRLEAKWRRETKNLARTDPRRAAIAADFTDRSVSNLASIVALAECDSKRILLTGDARGDHVMTALDEAGLSFSLTDRVDVLKVPHHGSDRNAKRSFFEAVPADHYLISADGKHDNPSVATLRMISEARPDDDFTLHFTNREMDRGIGEAVATFLEDERQSGRSYRANFRDDAASSISIELLP